MPNRLNPVCILLLSVLMAFVQAVALATSLPELRYEGNRVWAGQGYLVEYDGIKVLHLKGTPFEMGVQHGVLLGEEASALRPYVDPALQERTGMDKLVWLFQDFYMNVKLLPTFLRNIPERYIEEMQGFIHGASGGKDKAIKPIVVSNVSQDLSVAMCTSLAVWGSASVDGHLYHARNLDNSLPLVLAKSALVMIVEPEGKIPFITLSYPANFGVMHAMNAKGITISMSYSFAVENSIDGLPLVFLLREVMERAETLDQAVHIIKEAPRTIGLNILIGDAKEPRAVVVEAAANHYAVRTADDFIAATNRYASSQMQPYQRAGWYASALRDSRLAELEMEHRGRFNAQVLATVLRDKFSADSAAHQGMVRGIDNANTMASLVFDPTRGLMWVGVQDENAPASDHTMQAFSLTAALAGEEARQPQWDISYAEDEYLRDWLTIYSAERALAESRPAAALEILATLDEPRQYVEYVLLLKARAHMQLGRHTEAEQFYGNLTELAEIAEPRHLQEALFYLGVYADRRNERNAAVAWYAKSLAVPVPDLGGETDYYRQQAQSGLERSLTKKLSLWEILWKAQVFGPGTSPVLEPEGEIAAISVLGGHKTDTAWLLGWLGVSVGDRLDQSRLQTWQRQLRSLNAFENVTLGTVAVNDDQVHLIIRIREGFGLYKEPLATLSGAIYELTQKTLSVRYDHFAGKAINIGATYGWGPTRQRYVFTEFPIRIGAPMQLRLDGKMSRISFGAGVGPYAGTTVVVDRQEYKLSSVQVLSPIWSLHLNAQWIKDSAVEVTPVGSVPADNQVGFVSAGINRQTSSGGRSSAFSLSVGWLDECLTAAPGRLRFVANTEFRYPISSNMQIVTGMTVGWQDPTTPLNYQFRLGGSSTLRGYDPTVTTTAYAHGTLEVRRYFRSDLHVAVFADGAIIDDGARQRLTLWSPGVAVRYYTPIALTAMASAQWNPTEKQWRFQAGFTSSW
ncbi:MAG TPA: BamA/TamA family outer membrane protein [Firmicutes bacterium]|jgi:isopenicillin-N N-acyltransferase-like protein|nr:BamA/TamA family outer membrane protein [Bacillota bacterium]